MLTFNCWKDLNKEKKRPGMAIFKKVLEDKRDQKTHFLSQFGSITSKEIEREWSKWDKNPISNLNYTSTSTTFIHSLTWCWAEATEAAFQRSNLTQIYWFKVDEVEMTLGRDICHIKLVVLAIIVLHSCNHWNKACIWFKRVFSTDSTKKLQSF